MYFYNFIYKLNEEYLVKSIESDISLTISENEDANEHLNLNSGFKIVPKVD
jgi:hypothetical protein